MSAVAEQSDEQVAVPKVNARAYAPIVNRVRDYLEAESRAATPTATIAYVETNDGDVVELTLSDLISVTYLATLALPEWPAGGEDRG